MEKLTEQEKVRRQEDAGSSRHGNRSIWKAL